MADVVARALAMKALNKPVASPDEVKTAVDDYLSAHPVVAGATAEEAQQIETNKNDISKLQADMKSSIRLTLDEDEYLCIERNDE